MPGTGAVRARRDDQACHAIPPGGEPGSMY